MGVLPARSRAEPRTKSLRLVRLDDRVRVYALREDAATGHTVARCHVIPFATAIDAWQALQVGQHTLGLVMLIIPTDAGPDTFTLQAVLEAAARRAGFHFVPVPWRTPTAEAVATWQSCAPWQPVTK
jgi:hypothetical protein